MRISERPCASGWRRAIRSVLAAALLAAGAARGAERTPVRVVLLPVIDALPVHVAAEDGAFAAAGLDVQRIPAAAAAERDQILQAGKGDLAVTDLVALALYRQGGLPMIAVRHSMQPCPGHPQFRILAGGPAERRPATAAALRGAHVAISAGTVSEYVTTRLLAAAGIGAGDVTLDAVPAIPTRMALLGSGQLAAATLPEPLASLAERRGAAGLTDDAQVAVPGSCAVFAAARRFADAHPAALRQFLRVVAESSAALNRDPVRARAALARHRLLPPELADTFRMPPYPGDTVPDDKAWDDVCAWLSATGRLKAPIARADVITHAYLPRHD